MTAEASLPLFLDIYIALDVSSSMGVGATQEDINIMNAAIGCAFGCHAGSDNYERAHAAGATLRIDVLRSAIAAMLQKAKGDSEFAEFVARTSSASASMLFRTVSPRCRRPRPIILVLNQAVAGIEPDRIDGGTNFHVALGQQFDASVAAERLRPWAGERTQDPRHHRDGRRRGLRNLRLLIFIATTSM